MIRSFDALSGQRFDLLIVGAGVCGAALAYEASQRGFSVAVIDRGDFAGGASSNSLKILHGGLRYLQRLDLRRMRSSIRARRSWSMLSPNFVTPLACAVATRGLGLRSKLAVGGALLANELISADRNAGVLPHKHLPGSRLLSRNEYAQLTRGVCTTATGGALWYDALALDTERLVLELLARAADRGAFLANYVEAKSILSAAGRVEGVIAADVESGSPIEIRAKRVICTGNSTGIARTLEGLRRVADRARCKALNLVVDRALPTGTALALPVKHKVALGAVQGDLFFVPWRGRTMIGTHYSMPTPSLDDGQSRRAAVADFLEAVRSAAPALEITQKDVTFVHWGELPLARDWRPGQPIKLDSEPEVIDAEAATMLAGLWLISIPKFTTALEVARTTLDSIVRNLQPSDAAAKSVSIAGGAPSAHLLRMDQERDFSVKARLAAVFLYARKLEDVVLRRTGCGTSGHPGRPVLEACANGMAPALRWTPERKQREINAMERHYAERHCWSAGE